MIRKPAEGPGHEGRSGDAGQLVRAKRFVARPEDHGMAWRDGLSPKSVRIVHAVLHKALSGARRKGTLARNVAEVADAPKLHSAVKRQEIKVWTPEELRRFLELAADNRNHAAWFVTSHTGMRRGEVLRLRWSDVDLASEGSQYAKFSNLVAGVLPPTVPAGEVIDDE